MIGAFGIESFLPPNVKPRPNMKMVFLAATYGLPLGACVQFLSNIDTASLTMIVSISDVKVLRGRLSQEQALEHLALR